MPPPDDDITRLLAQAHDGDADALSRLIPVVYDELHALAQQQRRRRTPGDTLNTTALVHEAYEKLARGGKAFVDRQHFFRVAARVMRGVLVDHARARQRQKRGDGAAHLPLDEGRLAPPEAPDQLLALDEALTRLTALDPRQAEVVELRYFVGLTVPEAADVLGRSEATVKRDWTVARAWLHHALSEAA
ncbi:MAG TPA: sigma-70 family RNA polymerase sigma factor [Rubricoccaceae bacterium]|nr:sigma-70 family RNA polymerase sigma factor [Rubricoccaceae bacterium]